MLLKKHFLLLLSVLKTIVLLNIFVKTIFSSIFKWIEQHLFEIEIFGNIINVFTVNFDQFNVFLLNKVLISFFFNGIWMVVYKLYKIKHAV